MIEIIDSEFSRQFQTKVNNETAFIEYSVQDIKIFLTRIYIPENAEASFFDDFMKKVLENIAERRLKVVPTCSKAVSFFRKNKEYQGMLSVGIRL